MYITRDNNYRMHIYVCRKIREPYFLTRSTDISAIFAPPIRIIRINPDMTGTGDI